MPYTEFACRASGSNLYAGTLTGGTTEVSTTPVVTYTAGSWVNATRVFTVAAGNPITDGVAVGDYCSVYADGAAAPTGFVGKITARDATTITVSATISSGTNPTDGAGNRTMVVGGAWLGPTGASGFPFNFATGDLVTAAGRPVRINFKNDQTYSITASIAASRTGLLYYRGYTTTYGDTGRATIDGTSVGASFTLLTATGIKTSYENFTFQNNGTTGQASGLVVSQGGIIFRKIYVTAVRGYGIQHTTGQCEFIECEATACNQSNTANLSGMHCSIGGTFTRCISHNNTGSNSNGFRMNGGSLNRCISDTNGNFGVQLAASGTLASLHQCSIYGNTSDGVNLVSVDQGHYYFENCLFVANGGYGVNQVSAVAANPGTIVMQSCGFQGNTTDKYNSNIVAENVLNEVTISSNPFTDAPNGDFSLSLAAAMGTGRGAFMQQTGYTETSTAAPDLGAVQGQGGVTGTAEVDLKRLRREFADIEKRMRLLWLRQRAIT